MAGFCICACYGGHVWRYIKLHTATSFGKVQDHRKCAFCPREEVRDRFLGAAIRTEGEWRVVVPTPLTFQERTNRAIKQYNRLLERLAQT